jgi:hypothetical protein
MPNVQHRRGTAKPVRKSLASGLGEICLPNEEWRLWTGGASSHKLLPERKLEDLFLWNRFELSSTTIGPQAARFLNGEKNLGRFALSLQAQNGLQAFAELFPEWLKSPYMKILPEQRKRRIITLFGDVPVALEPQLEEIPEDLYQRLLLQKLAGGPAALRGGPVDLVLIKVPRLLPMEHRAKLINDYLKLLYAGESAGEEIRLSGKGGLYFRRRHELELLGKYRLFRANGFDLNPTLVAAYGRADRRDDSFYEAKRFITRLLAVRWKIFWPFFSLIGGGPPLGE